MLTDKSREPLSPFLRTGRRLVIAAMALLATLNGALRPCLGNAAQGNDAGAQGSNVGAQDAIGQDTPQEVTEAQIREVLSDAFSVLTFEPGSYVLSGAADYVQLRDYGPRDQYARFEGGIHFASGIAGQAYSLGQDNSSMRIPNLRELISQRHCRQLTVSFWHKPADRRNTFLFCCGIHSKRSVTIGLLKNGRLQVALGGTVLETPKQAYSPDWQHVVMVFDYTEIHLYLNGELFESWKITPTILNSRTIGSASTYIGGNSMPDSRRIEQLYYGLIDEIAILPTPATPEQVKLLYNWTKAGNVFPELEDNPEIVKGTAHGVPGDIPRHDFMQEFSVQQDPRYAGVAKILTSATAVYNFEPGTYSRDRVGLSMLIQDLGPGDNWATCAGNAIRFAPGVVGQGYSFDGIKCSLLLPSTFGQLVDGGDTATLTFWQKPGSKKNGVLFCCGANPDEAFALVIRDDMRYELHCGKGVTLVCSNSYWTDQWQHVAVVLDAGLVKFYLDGRLRETWLIPATTLDVATIGGDEVSIGAQPPNNNPERVRWCFHGVLDEFALLKRAADDEEIKLLYDWTQAGLPLPQTPDDPSLVTAPAHGSPWDIPLGLPPGIPDTSARDSARAKAEAAANDPRAHAIRKLVDKALALYTFDPGTHLAHAEAKEMHVQDLSHTDNWGNATGTVAFAEGIAGKAMVFDGDTTVIDLPTLSSLLVDGRQQLTVSLWHRATSSEGKRMLFYCGSWEEQGIVVRLEPDQHYFICAGGTNVLRTKEPLATDQWQHVVVVFDGPRVSLYLDGELAESWEIPLTSFDNNSVRGKAPQSRIGRCDPSDQNVSSQCFPGLLDEIAILPQAISAEEVQLLYEWGHAGHSLPDLGDIPELLTGPAHGVKQRP